MLARHVSTPLTRDPAPLWRRASAMLAGGGTTTGSSAREGAHHLTADGFMTRRLTGAARALLPQARAKGFVACCAAPQSASRGGEEAQRLP